MRGIPHWARYSAATLSGRMTMAFPGRLAGPWMPDCSCRTVNDEVILAVNSWTSTTPNSHINAMVMRLQPSRRIAILMFAGREDQGDAPDSLQNAARIGSLKQSIVPPFDKSRQMGEREENARAGQQRASHCGRKNAPHRGADRARVLAVPPPDLQAGIKDLRGEIQPVFACGRGDQRRDVETRLASLHRPQLRFAAAYP